MNQIENSYTKQNKHALNGSVNVHDERSIKSLDFESDNEHITNYDDYASEPVPAPKLRPTPPKKPLRLSLQRARSLQAVCGDDSHSESTPLMDTTNDKKRAIKRIYRGDHQLSTFRNGKLSNRYSKSIEIPSKYNNSCYSTISTNYRQKFV